MKYLKRLQEDPSKQEAKELTNLAKKASLNAQVDILETESALEEAKELLEKLKGSKDLSLVALVEQQNIVDGYQKGLDSLQELIKELF